MTLSQFARVKAPSAGPDDERAHPPIGGTGRILGRETLVEVIVPGENDGVVRETDSFGVLTLTLAKRSYKWRFVAEVGSEYDDDDNGRDDDEFSDCGSALCLRFRVRADGSGRPGSVAAAGHYPFFVTLNF